MSKRFEHVAEVLKVQEDLGLVFGMAIVCNEDGEPYFDTQGDHIPESAMLEAATDFMLKSRVAADMHDRASVAGSTVIPVDGQVVFAFPLTEDVAKAFEIECPRTGLLVAVKPSPDVLEKFKRGEYTGFSIGGARLQDEEVD